VFLSRNIDQNAPFHSQEKFTKMPRNVITINSDVSSLFLLSKTN
jgi:hypothetical protein